jgi:hypothetical protein
MTTTGASAGWRTARVPRSSGRSWVISQGATTEFIYFEF